MEIDSMIIGDFLRARFNIDLSYGICCYLLSGKQEKSKELLIQEFKLNIHLFDKNVLSPSALLFLEGENINWNKKYMFVSNEKGTLARIKLIDIILSKYGNI